MTSELFTVYGYLPVPDDVAEHCRLNPILKPLGFKHLGMGLIKVVATSIKDKNKYFIFDVGGPSGEEYLTNKKIMMDLYYDDALTWGKLIKLL